jgi:transposase
VARCPCGLWAAQDAIQPLETVERQGHFRSDDGWSGRRARRKEDRDDRRHLPEGTPHSDQLGRKKGGRGRLIGRTNGGMNTKLHAICDSQGRPLNLFVTAGQVSDYIGARALVSSLPKVDWLLGDRGYDADWFREALQDKGIRACIPGRKQRNKAVKYDKRRYKRRNRIEIMFGRLKDWRRVATRYDRCPKVFLSAIALAALVIYWL